MAYTPELSQFNSAVLRRIAWYFNKPMTKTLEAIILQIASLLKNDQICEACRDKSFCNSCPFSNEKSAEGELK